ncbi:MAG: H(+)/Cl(-) exchange transporter ClcA [Armatimonadetes bacterium]|nr:H(+)/Cl(-) exchange transporter ClcA [Armatimonadota bacterium]
MTLPSDPPGTAAHDHRALERRGLLLCAVTGLLVGAASVGFQAAVGAFERTSQEVLAPFTHQGPLQFLAIVLCGASLGYLAGFMTERFCPEAGGSGIPHIKAVLMNLRIVRPFGLITVKVGAGLAALLAGMSLGREGPTIQIGGALGALMADMAKVPQRLRLSMIASGAGAGLAAAFNAPLAGFIFVMEELRREMSPLTYGLALLASVCSVAVARFAFGQVPSFILLEPRPVPLHALLVVVLLGIVSALVGVAFNILTIRLVLWREKHMSRRSSAAVIGGLSCALLAVLPQVSGGGHPLAEAILRGDYVRTSLGFLLLVLLTKLALTSSSFATGVPGGIFAPLLVMGAVTGFLVGTVFSRLLPGFGIQPDVFATLGMAAVLSASVRAPLTGVVLIVEMTQQYALLYALLVAAFVSYILANLLRNQPIYESLLERDLHRTGHLGELPTETFSFELLIQPDSPLDGVLIQNARLPEGALVTTIRRQERFVQPRGATQIQYGDELTVQLLGSVSEADLVSLHDAARSPHPADPV